MKLPKLTSLVRWMLLLLITVSAIGWSGVTVAQERLTGVIVQERPSAAPFDFQGRFIVSVSDADMLPSAYIDDKLGPIDGADALSIIRLDRAGRELRAIETPVSNSVTGPPAVIAVTPDGRYAIVIETRGQRPTTADPRLSDLALGRTISVVDLTDLDQPQVVQRVQGFEQPLSVSINFNGSLVAVSYDPGGAGKTTPLAIYRFSDGRLSAPVTPQIPDWRTEDTLIHVEWHPKENILALLNVNKPSISFMRVANAGSQISLLRWGNSVSVEKAPFLVRFTPDGRHIISNSSYVRIDGVQVLPSASLRGTVQSIRLVAETAADGSPVHQLASRAATSSIPEGLSISPDGRYVVTTNLEQSSFALDDSKQGFFSSLTLLRLDPETGILESVGDFAFDGVLPEAAVFDNSSRFLAVTNFTFFDPNRKGGSIDFWGIVGDAFDPKRTELVKMNYSTPVTRGAHSIAIVR
ncbi:hypothetical protein [Nostoc sp. MG11]|uniref:hypothetical protein n=1 Tax=Nostoc sp. MG11 TaxID=2721166 RepID=UPI001D02BFFB|nr:hypothetical protein [Nostoc sp. MG11]